MLNKLSVGQKLLLAGIGLPFIVAVLFFVLYYQQAYQKNVDSMVERARAICLTAESVRQEMDARWEAGVFSFEQLKAYAAAGEVNKVLMTIPVVTAWTAVAKKKKEGDYEFKVPKFKPRNPGNEPDEIEAEVLTYLKENDLDEHYVIDHKQNAVRYFRAVRLTESCLYCHGDPALSSQYWGNDEGLDMTGVKMENWKLGEIHGAFEVIQRLDEADHKLYFSTGVAAAISTIGFAIIGLVFFSVSNGITRPVLQAVEFVRRMASGDMRGSMDLSRHDELGTLAQAMTSTTAQLRSTLRKLETDAISVARGGEVTDELFNGIIEDLNSARQEASQVADRSQNLAQNVNTMAAASEEMSASANTVATAMAQMTSTVNEISQHCARQLQSTSTAMKEVQHNREIVSRLDQSADEIGKVVTLISDIADRTNLLALNATIEAASAGEAGKGFAVVANEVKELARQTSDATEQISSQISQMRSIVADTVADIEKISDVIDDVNKSSQTIAAAVEEQSATTSEVARSIEAVSTASRDLSSNIQTTANFSNDVAKKMETIQKSVANAFFNSEQTGNLIHEFVSRGERVDQSVHQFQIGSAAFDISSVKAAHLQWLTRLTEVLRGGASMKPEEVASAKQCKFGRWYYESQEGRTVAKHPQAPQMETHHNRVHELARQIVSLVNQNNFEQAMSLMGEFEQERRTLFDILDDIYIDLSNQKQG